MTYRKKLIEVALPLEAINRESAREKSIRHGHPSTLHLWWARRPLAACRAVLFASLVDDPSSRPDEFPTHEAQAAERQRLFDLIQGLVLWENSNNEEVLDRARAEIMKSTDGHPPPVLDPFCGGGSIPLEAQRLGLKAYASDLNPVAVLITKALIEIPPKFAGMPPVNPESRQRAAMSTWQGAQGLAEDVRYYGKWMRDEAEGRIGHLYPKVTLPEEYGGGGGTVIAWLWARTVKCPNPACGAQMPLVSSYWLSKKPGKQAWVEPVVDHTAKTVRFTVQTSASTRTSSPSPLVGEGVRGRGGKGGPPDPPKLGRGAKFRCLVCEQVADGQHLKAEGMAGRMGGQLMAIVAEGDRRRIYLPPDEEHVRIAESAEPIWKPTQGLPNDPRAIWCVGYGLDTYDKLFTPRQLVALTTFSDLVGEARELALRDALAAGIADDGVGIDGGGTGAQAYADAVGTYLALAASKLADYNSTLSVWSPLRDQAKATFARQALPMVWDYTEVNPLAEAAGDMGITVRGISKTVAAIPPAGIGASVTYLDASAKNVSHDDVMVATDPPYYDNIGYADLADFFYVWLRRSLSRVYSDLFSTLLTPKAQELIASPYRFDGSRESADEFFEEGLGRAFSNMRRAQSASLPMTLFYAFKQSESVAAGSAGEVLAASTGWETMLQGLLASGFAVTGTWPMRTERGARTIGIGTNALASSIVLVCRPRPDDAPLATRRELLTALRHELPEALRNLQHGNIAPVDLAQAAIGPGMAVFSRYGKVVEADGTPMRVRTALQLINQVLDEVLAEQDTEYDEDTRWAVAWYEQYGMQDGPFGDAETLAKAKVVSVEGLVSAGVLSAKGGKARLLRRDELAQEWDPRTDRRLTIWEVSQHLIRTLETAGETGAAELLRRVGGLGEVARDLAYRLYTTAERKGWAKEALAYNSLVVAWPEIRKLAGHGETAGPTQTSFLGEGGS